MRDWKPISTAPFGMDVEVTVVGGRAQPLALLCQQTKRGWVLTSSGERVPIKPTHWRAVEPFFGNLDRRASSGPR
jgi:hypothetical protein